MPGKIKLLSEEIIGKIAAGEVVQRPSAAIKQLVENSLDAGATAVTVEIRDGGISYFRVSDNGGGIDSSDIRMAFERHATSKIHSANDLSSIQTLGFRGEALASIASVSSVTCTTRTREETIGLKVHNKGGQFVSIEEAACPQGTTIVVRDLFFNTPVRLKFLKKSVTEAGYVSDLIMRLILSRPDVSFRYISQGKTVYHSAGDGKLESAVFSIYGNELIQSMRKVHGNENGILLDGYVGIGESARSNRSHQSFFINGRYLKSSLLSSAVETACKERVMIGKMPTCVLHLTMPYDTVDVNVHPNKLQVRFANESSVIEALENIIRDSIRDKDLFEHPVQMPLNPATIQSPTVNISKQTEVYSADSKKTEVQIQRNTPQLTVKPQITYEPKPSITSSIPLEQAIIKESPKTEPIHPLQVKPFAASASSLKQNNNAVTDYIQASLAAKKDNPLANVRERSAIPKAEHVEQLSSVSIDEAIPFNIIGTVFNTYIMLEYKDQLLLIDQHAVHERLLYDRLSKEWDQENIGQQLLIPIIMHVTGKELNVLEQNLESLQQLCLVLEGFGENEIAVRSIPMILGEPQTESFVREIIDQLMSERGKVTMERRRSAILQIACKKAVKGGQRLTDDDLRWLVESVVKQHSTPTCPHGRPLVISITHNELDKKFRRIQS